MRLSKIIIKNFKNYIGEHEIELDRKITILYGENGYGKSSFFDAIEWALTGTINRFEKDPNFSVQDLINDTIYNDSNNECSVSIKLNDLWVKRYINLKNKSVYVKLTGFYFDNKMIKKEVEVTGKDNVEIILKEILFNSVSKNNLLNSMIKHSFILSQDQVTDFIVRDDPKERYKSIADIMGLRRIINYSENIKLFLTQLRSKEKEILDDIDKETSIVKLVKSDQENFEDIKGEYLKTIKDSDLIDESRFSEKIESKIQSTSNFIYQINITNNLYKELLKMNIFTYSSLNKKVVFLNDRIEKYYRHISYIDLSINNLEAHLSRLSKQEMELKEYNGLLEKKETLIQKRNKIVFSLKENNLYSNNMEPSDVDNRITKLQSEIDIFNFALINKNDYISSKEFINKFGKLRSSLNLDYEYVNNKLKRKQKWLNKLSLALADQNNESSLSSLLEGVKEILNYTKQIKEDDECPVCSSNVKGLLQNNIQNNIEKYKGLISVQSQRVQKLSDLIASLRNQVNVLNKDLKGIKEKNERLEEDKKYYQEMHESIIGQKNYVEEIINYDNGVLTSKLEVARENIRLLIQIKQELLDLLSIGRNLEIVDKQISEKEREKANQVNEGIERRKSQLLKRNNYLGKIKSDLEQLQIDIDVYKSYLDKLRKENERAEEFIIGVELNNQKLTNQQEILKKLKAIEQKFYQYKNNKDIYFQIERAKASLKSLGKQRKENKIIISTLEAHIEEINKTFGEEAMDFLNKPHSLIQKYYRYMNPMTTSKHLKFISNSNEELQIKIYDEFSESELNAKTTLSSGQLNVLAISIFLASGNSFDSNIDFIGIDDPIQNMDDVNRFSICDMIGSIDKQLIFSTHDLEFLKLFIKKNEHLSDDIQVYNFVSPILKENSISRITL